MKKPREHTLESLTNALARKKIAGISVLDIRTPLVDVLDSDFGKYTVDIKSFCDSMDFPMHKGRRHQKKMASAAAKIVGKSIGGFIIKTLFYGPDRGYKNRSFYVEVESSCGHTVVTTVAHLKKHREPESECHTCAKTIHGVRGKKDGVRIKRTPTYIHWQRVRTEMPKFLQEFEDFRRILGDKPYNRAEVVINGASAHWVPLTITSDKETNLIATAIRQAFRHSELYKAALADSRVETTAGTRYKCASCGDLDKQSNIQVDHIDPIMPIDGSPLKRENLIERIWTDKIQVLDKKCHSIKSSNENKARREVKTMGKTNKNPKWDKEKEERELLKAKTKNENAERRRLKKEKLK